MSKQLSPYSDLRGPGITLCKTLPEDIGRIMEFESDNNLFVSQYSREKHMELLDDENCMHLSIKRNDNGKLVGLILLFGILLQLGW